MSTTIWNRRKRWCAPATGTLVAVGLALAGQGRPIGIGPIASWLAAVGVVVTAVMTVLHLNEATPGRDRLHSHVYRVPCGRDEFVLKAAMAISGPGNRELSMPTPNMVVVTSHYVNALMVLPVVLLFPAGLLVLLCRSTGETKLLITPHQNCCDVQVAGWLRRPDLVRKLEALFEDLVSPGEAASSRTYAPL